MSDNSKIHMTCVPEKYFEQIKDDNWWAFSFVDDIDDHNIIDERIFFIMNGDFPDAISDKFLSLKEAIKNKRHYYIRPVKVKVEPYWKCSYCGGSEYDNRLLCMNCGAKLF